MASKDSDWAERPSGWKQQPEDLRSPFDVDYARIVHSGSFRRLQGKTQILNLGDSDFYRTRLTHSLEVAQIAGSIARQLEGNMKPMRRANTSRPSASFSQPVLAMISATHPSATVAKSH
jgi:dGTPase